MCVLFSNLHALCICINAILYTIIGSPYIFLRGKRLKMLIRLESWLATAYKFIYIGLWRKTNILNDMVEIPCVKYYIYYIDIPNQIASENALCHFSHTNHKWPVRLKRKSYIFTRTASAVCIGLRVYNNHWLKCASAINVHNTC